jgi:biotin synthase
MTMSWDALANRVIEGQHATRDELLAVLRSDDNELLSVLQAAFKIRAHHHGRKVKVHVLQNAKSGQCPEDCAFCSQSTRFQSPIDRYPMQQVDELVEGARAAAANGAYMYCMVTSTRGPTGRELETICEATRRIKAELPVRVCASLGILKPGQAAKLAEAGVNRYNHNIETSERHFPNIVNTHRWSDRVDTIREAKEHGLEACCGGIMGLGEDEEDRVDMAIALRELEVESVPVNFLDPRPGTPLSESPRLSPAQCLRALAMFRFACAAADVRVAGGREVSLGHMQPLALWVVNSMFTNGYLTTGGAQASDDWRMIEQAGFEPHMADSVPTSSCSSC